MRSQAKGYGWLFLQLWGILVMVVQSQKMGIFCENQWKIEKFYKLSPYKFMCDPNMRRASLFLQFWIIR